MLRKALQGREDSRATGVGLTRSIPSNHPYNSDSLQPLARALFSASKALSHALATYKHLSLLKSSTVSPDGLLGGRGYVMSVKDIRARLLQASEALSDIVDTVHDEIEAPHWKKPMDALEEDVLGDVRRLIHESTRINDSEEGDAEKDIAEVEAVNNDGPDPNGDPQEGNALGQEETEEDTALPEDPEQNAFEEDATPEETPQETPEDGADPEEGSLEDETTPEQASPEQDGETPDFDVDFETEFEGDTDPQAPPFDYGGQDPEEEDSKEDVLTPEPGVPEAPLDVETEEVEETEEADPEDADGLELDLEELPDPSLEAPVDEEDALEPDEDDEEESEDEEETPPPKKPFPPKSKSKKPKKKGKKPPPFKTKKATSSIEPDTLSGPRVEHVDRGRTPSPNGSWLSPGDHEMDILQEGMGRDTDYDDVDTGLLLRSAKFAASTLPYDARKTESFDFGIGYGARGEGIDAEPHGATPGTKVTQRSSLPTEPLRPRDKSMLPGDTSHNLPRELRASSGLPTPLKVPAENDTGLPGGSSVSTDMADESVVYDYATHSLRKAER